LSFKGGRPRSKRKQSRERHFWFYKKKQFPGFGFSVDGISLGSGKRRLPEKKLRFGG
jgi:hypothetical protein